MREPGDDEHVREATQDDIDEDEREAAGMTTVGELLASINSNTEVQRGRRRNRFESIIAAGA